MSGPPFLLHPEREWPMNPDGSGELVPDDPEIKKSVTVNAAQTEEEVDVVTCAIHHFSSWTRLKNTVAWILRLKNLLLSLSQKRKQLSMSLAQSGLDKDQQMYAVEREMQRVKTQTGRGCLSVEDLREAEMEIIRFCQRKGFPDSPEFSSLQRGESVKRNSHIYKLNPILKDGILRVGGQLSKAAMPKSLNIRLYWQRISTSQTSF